MSGDRVPSRPDMHIANSQLSGSSVKRAAFRERTTRRTACRRWWTSLGCVLLPYGGRFESPRAPTWRAPGIELCRRLSPDRSIHLVGQHRSDQVGWSSFLQLFGCHLAKKPFGHTIGLSGLPLHLHQPPS
jgi:hypothetical protein